MSLLIHSGAVPDKGFRNQLSGNCQVSDAALAVDEAVERKHKLPTGAPQMLAQVWWEREGKDAGLLKPFPSICQAPHWAGLWVAAMLMSFFPLRYSRASPCSHHSVLAPASWTSPERPCVSLRSTVLQSSS